MLSQTEKEGRSIFFLFNPEQEDIWIECRLQGSLAGRDFYAYLPGSESVFAPVLQDGAYLISLPAKSACFLVEAGAEDKTSPQALPDLVKSQELSGRWQFKPGLRNCLILDSWILASPDSPIAQDEINYNLETDHVAPGPCHGHGVQDFPAELVYKTIVRLKNNPGRLSLVRELSGLAGDAQIFVNGQLVEDWQKERVYDCNNLVADLAPFLVSQDKRLYRKGELTITVRVRVQDKDSGLLFPLRLMGDFTVGLNQQSSSGALLTGVAKNQELNTGSWTDQGYPHYAGSGEYSQEFELTGPDPASRYFLEFATGGHVAEVLLNGKRAGVRLQEEAVEITGLLQAGRNKLAIIVSNTLENLLYGSGAACGIMSPVRIVSGPGKAKED
jgi:hypothetical protein